MGTTSEERKARVAARVAQIEANRLKVKQLKEKGETNVSIANTLGIPEMTVWHLLKESHEKRN